MIYRALIVAICLIGLPQVSEGQASIEEIYEQIRADPFSPSKYVCRGGKGQLRFPTHQEKIRYQEDVIRDFIESLRELDREVNVLERQHDNIKSEERDLKIKLKTALSQDQRDSLGLPRTSKASGH